jgi:hypothetical protein
MQQGLQLEDGMDDVDVAIIADRNRDIQQLDRDMEELAEVYQVRQYFCFVFLFSNFFCRR